MSESHRDMQSEPGREEALFQAAAQLSGDQRAIFLNGACYGDPALRQRLEALLATREQPGGLLETQAESVLPTIKLELIDAPDEAVGQTLGRYKLLEKIGEGGCGVVYVAEQTEPVRRRIALKVIKLGMDTKQVVARFEAERQALAMMDHPNIAKVLDAGTTDTGRPYFVMELVRGIRITEYCDQNNLTTKERLDLFIKVCQAIQHAHQKGIIHRDIKPSNILVTLHDGVPVPKVIDFGIAKATEGRLTDNTVYTQLHQFIGTPAYMSPEQAEMSGLDIDTRSDIYSLGVLLYELLTGRTPFSAEELAASGLDAMRKTIREKEPVRPSTRLGTLSGEELTTTAKRRSADTAKLLHQLKGDLDWIVMKCLEKDRTRRYETANGVAFDLKRHLNNDPVLARPPSAAYKFQKAFRRNKLVFAAGTAVVVALVAGLGLAALGWRQTRVERDKAIQAQSSESIQRQKAEANEQKAVEAQASETKLREQAQDAELAARRRAYAADMNILQQALTANDLRRARALLGRQRPKNGEQDLRGWEWRYLWQSCQGDALFKLYQQPFRVLFAGFANDGKVVTFNDAAMLSLWDTNTKAEVGRFQEPVAGANVHINSSEARLSPDGEWVAAISRDNGAQNVKIWSISTKELMAVFPNERGEITSIAFSPDKKVLAFFVPGVGVSIWDTATRQRLILLPVASVTLGFLNNCGAVQFSPDGSILAIGDTDGQVRLVNVKTFTETDAFAAAPDINNGMGVMSLAFSPDGRVLAAGTAFRDSAITLWDVVAKAKLRILTGHRGFVPSLAFSPDGKILASASGDQTIKLWNTATWQEMTTLIGHEDEVWSVGFSTDGTTLVSSGKDGSVYLWPAEVGRLKRGPRSLETGATTFQSLLFQGLVLSASFDTENIVTINSDGTVTLWDVATARKKSVPAKLGTNNAAVFWGSASEILVGARHPATIKVWNPANDAVNEFPLDSDPADPVFLFQPQSRTILVAHTNSGLASWTYRRWEALSRREVASYTISGGFGSPEIAGDGRLMALSQDRSTISVRNVATGEEVYSLKAYTSGTLQGMAIFPDGKRLATASVEAPVVKVWDLATGRELVALRGHNLVIGRIVVSPDGQRLATSTIGQEPIKIWDTTSWEETASLEVPAAVVGAGAFLPGGNTLAGYEFGQGGVLRLWRATSWAEINAAEAREKAEIKPP